MTRLYMYRIICHEGSRERLFANREAADAQEALEGWVAGQGNLEGELVVEDSGSVHFLSVAGAEYRAEKI